MVDNKKILRWELPVGEVHKVTFFLKFSNFGLFSGR